MHAAIFWRYSQIFYVANLPFLQYFTVKMFSAFSCNWYRLGGNWTFLSFTMFCAIWYHLYNLKNVKNTHGGVLLLVKLQANLQVTKSNTPPLVFFTFFKLYKWYQIAQRITWIATFIRRKLQQKNNWDCHVLGQVLSIKKLKTYNNDVIIKTFQFIETSPLIQKVDKTSLILWTKTFLPKFTSKRLLLTRNNNIF